MTASPSHNRVLHCKYALLLLLILQSHAGNAETKPSRSIELNPETVRSGPNSPKLQPADEGVSCTLPFSKSIERVYWDIPLSNIDAKARAVAIKFDIAFPAAARALSLHLRHGTNWLSTSASLSGQKADNIIFQLQDFKPDNGTPEWAQADTLRVSVWRGAPQDSAFTIQSIALISPDVAILQASVKEHGTIARQHALRALRLFETAGIDASLISGDLSNFPLKDLRLVVLPYNPDLSDQIQRKLASFVTKHNGRLAVFYQSSPVLAELVGVKLRSYTTQHQPWREVRLDCDQVSGLPRYIPHTTSHLLPVSAGTDGHTTGYWISVDGFIDQSLPAAAQTDRGIWFSHTPPLASSQAVQWLLASLAALDNHYASARDTFLKRNSARRAKAAAVAASVLPAENEIRGVWARNIGSGRRPQVLQQLSKLGINTVFEKTAAGGFLLDRENTPADSRAADTPIPQVLKAVKTARKNGMAYHAWIPIFNAGFLSQNQLNKLETKQRLMQDREGNTMPWLCPSHPENKQLILHLVKRLTASSVDGIHLDYIRYPGQRGCYSTVSRRAFEQRTKLKAENWPDDVEPGGRLSSEYKKFLTAEITGFVENIHDTIKDANASCMLTAAVFPSVESARENAQDWPTWCRKKLIDYVCPMIYTDSTAGYEAQLTKTSSSVPASSLSPGIGVLSDISRLDALATAEQIKATRNHGTAGFVMFALNIELLERTLPALSLPAAKVPKQNQSKN